MAAPIRFPGPVVTPLERGERTFAPPDAAGESFADVFRRVIHDSSGLQADAKDAIAAFLRGEPVELHQVMAASEEASLSLELLVELRNKLTDAYRAVMNLS
jgi:flagellar hook-basal body complex protein FliE